MGDYFKLHEHSAPHALKSLLQQKSNITSELQQTPSNDIKSIQKVDETSKLSDTFVKSVPLTLESSTIEQSSSSNEGIVGNTIEKICPYCNERMKPTEFMDHVSENHPGYSLFPSIDELNLYKMTHGVKKTG